MTVKTDLQTLKRVLNVRISKAQKKHFFSEKDKFTIFLIMKHKFIYHLSTISLIKMLKIQTKIVFIKKM